VGKASIISGGKYRQLQPSLQLHQVLSAGLSPLGVLRPNRRADLQLLADDGQQRKGRLRARRQDEAGITQATQQHGETETVVIATPPPDHRQVQRRQRVAPNDLAFISREGKQLGTFRRSQQTATRHDRHSFFV
jgi:hypothetical protein